MRFATPLTQAILIRRYKRFLADVRLEDGNVLTIHCPNSGSMHSCSEPGSRTGFSDSKNPKRKYRHTLEMVKVGNTWVGVNTARTNSLVIEAIENGRIAELSGFDEINREVKTSKGSRLDIMLKRGEARTYIEVKNCSLVDRGCAQFPDAVTARGTKHLLELARLAALGHDSIIFFLVQRLDADRFEPAVSIDPLYSRTLSEVCRQGVRILVYQAAVTLESIEVVGSLPVQLPNFF